MAEGMQAGRLEITVVAALDGFARELRTKVEAAAEGLAAKVQVKIDDDGLRKQLKKAVKEASAGVSAKIKVKLDDDRLRNELRLLEERLQRSQVTVPVRPDDDTAGGSRNGLMGRIRALLTRAQGEADRNPVNLPVRINEGRSGGLFGGGGRPRGRTALIGALVAVAQPAVAWLGQLGAGLTALASSAAPAVGVLGALPGLIAAGATAAIGAKVAFAGFGEALKEGLKAQAQLAAGTKLTKAQQQKLEQSMTGLSKSAKKTVLSIVDVTGAWKGMRREVQERLFSKIADQVKPLSQKLLPQLSTWLGTSADQAGSLMRQMSKGAQTKSFAKDFGLVAASSNKLVGNLSRGSVNMGHSIGDFLVASAPFTQRVGAMTEGWTRWLRASTEQNRADGSIDRFLQRSLDTAKKVGQATVDAGHGLAGMGRAARESGDSLLSGLQFQMKYFNAWSKSAQGQQRMKSFFDQSLPVYRETIGLLGDLGKGLARASTDQGLVKLVRQIRYELVPSVGSFLNQLGRAVGPQIISLFSSLAGIFQQLSSAGLGLAVVAKAAASLAVGLNSLLHAVPGLGTALGGLLGTLLALRVLRTVSTMFTGLGSAVSRANTAMTGAPGRVNQMTSAWSRAGLVYRRVATQTGGLQGAARGATAATRVMSRGLGGLLGFMGGPLGAGLAVASIGLMAYADHQQEAAQAAAEHRSQVQSLADALRASSGAINDDVVAQARKLAIETDWGKASSKAGISTREMTEAILGQNDGLDGLESRLRAAAKATEHWEDRAGGKSTVKTMTDQGKAYLAAADAIGKHGTSLADARKELEDTGKLTEDLSTKGVTAYDRVKDAVKRLADATGDAEGRTSALKSLLDALSGKTRSYSEATQQLNARLLEMKAYAKDNAGVAKGKDMVKGGELDTSKQLGQDIYRLSSGFADDALAKVTAAVEKAQKAKLPLAEQLAAARTEAEGARVQLTGMLEKLGMSATEAGQVADQMGLIPDEIVTGLKLEGQGDVAIALAGVDAEFKARGTQSIKITAPTEEVQKELRDLGFKVENLKDGRVKITVKDDDAKQRLKDFIDTTGKVPSNKAVRMTAETQKAILDLGAVSKKIGSVKGRSFTMSALTGTARKVLEDLGFKIESVPGAKGAKALKITVPEGPPKSQAGRIQAAIDALHGKLITNTVTTTYRTQAGPAMNKPMPNANGNIVRFAQGGVNMASNLVKAFANGSEKHIAQIARPGQMRIWNEPETDGEAYLPLAKSKRTRSKAILDRVAEIFGGKVVYFANGGINPPTAQAAALNRQTRITRTASASSTANNAALVGGDLNITVGAVSTVGDAMEDAMFELRKIRLGGGGGNA